MEQLNYKFEENKLECITICKIKKDIINKCIYVINPYIYLYNFENYKQGDGNYTEREIQFRLLLFLLLIMLTYKQYINILHSKTKF